MRERGVGWGGTVKARQVRDNEAEVQEGRK